MSLSEAIGTQALWIQIWVGWLAVINLATLAAFLISPATRRDGIVIGLAFLANYVFMSWLYGQFGYTRILGLSHVLIWTPLALYLVFALRGDAIAGWRRHLTHVFLGSLILSLAFDYVDVARWLMGARGSLLPV